ncbi:hypothetical protein PBY51_017635 [Eleginops maclovinus]|uniref:Uncharacterized protein n=1 Tax=Eleginops maclovinus TaxID=56733 RepID=A0AAN7XKE2_ELEMC|nr:hypothetical protein PBY51_017635 [Eleginops maclovinus]
MRDLQSHGQHLKPLRLKDALPSLLSSFVPSSHPHTFSFSVEQQYLLICVKEQQGLRCSTVQPLSQADRDRPQLQGDTETPASECIHKTGEDLPESLTC